MKTNCILPFVVFALAIMALTSCSININKRGDKKLTTKTIKVDNFDKLSIGGAIDVLYTVSDSVSVKVKATDEQRECLNIYTKADGTLCIEQKANIGNVVKIGISNSDDIGIEICGPALQGVAIAGSGSFKCEGEMQTETFRASVAGSGDIDIKSIKSENAALTIAGSGDIHISNIWSKRLDSSIVGSGDIKVNANKVDQIYASTNGSGDIEIKCNDCGTVTASTSGSGDITLNGKVKGINKSCSGSGDIDTDNLIIEK